MEKKRMSNGPKPGRRGMKNAGFLALLVLIGLVVWAAMSGNKTTLKEVPLTEVVTRANNGELKKLDIGISSGTVDVTEKGKEKPTLKSRKDPNTSLKDEGLDTTKVTTEYHKESDTGNLWFIGGQLVVPLLFFVGIFWMMRQAQGQGNQAMSFGKSKARLYGNEKDTVKFLDVAGNAEAKQDLQEVVEFLKYPKKFEEVGAKIPKGVLLVGPPGTGKTMLARAVAGEANVPFFSISGSEFVEMFVGVGASRVRDLFAKAKKNSPCIIFIDEIDAVGRRRGSGMGGGHDEREQTLNQILVEMDGFEQGTNVIVLAATNRADVLDPALLRPGRFDRRVMIGLPERAEREAILKVHFEKKPLDSTVNIKELSKKTVGMAGADLANLANESAIIAARNNRKIITDADVTEAFEKVAIGPERKSKAMSDKEKELSAYHEGGHALVGAVLSHDSYVHKVTIIPRGGTGGVTWFLDDDDKSYHSINEYKDVLARVLGGRIAEKVIYGDDSVTTGAGNDLQKAAQMAREMVAEQGMGSKLRNKAFHTEDGMMLDRLVHERNYSEDTARLIDEEVAELIDEAAKRAEIVIKENRSFLEKIKDSLLEKETLDADEVKKLFVGTKLPKEAALRA